MHTHMHTHTHAHTHTHSPILSEVTVRIHYPHNDENMLKVRAYGVGREWLTAGLLKYECHYVITNVSLPQQLLKKARRRRTMRKKTNERMWLY